MATYTAEQLSGAGTPIEALTGGTTYGFVLLRPLSLTGSGYFTMETVRNGQGFYDSFPPLILNTLLTPNTVTCDVGTDANPYTATISQVSGGALTTSGNGSGIEIAITSTGWNGVLGSGTGTITTVSVINVGEDYVAGDTLTVARGTPGVQGLGFTNADNPLIITLSAANLKTKSPTNAVGTYDFTTETDSILSPISSSFKMSGVVAITNDNTSSFTFTPTANVAVSSSFLRTTGDIILEIDAV